MKIRKILAYCLTFMLVHESILINIDDTVYSDGNAVSKRDDAIEWLRQNQNDEGYWGENLRVHETLEVLKNIGEEQIKLGTEIDKASEWLETQTLSNNDYIFRFISTNQSQQNNGTQIIREHQNEDGGFGISRNYSSDVYDTLLSLDACMFMEEIPMDTVEKGIEYIVGNQMESGGFSYTDKTEDVYLTAYALMVLSKYKEFTGNTEDGVTKAITDCRDFLLLSEDGDELWGMEEDTINGTMMATMALADSDKEGVIRIGKIGARLKEDGSIYGNPVSTAMYIRLTGMFTEENAYAKISSIRYYTDETYRIGACTDIHIEPVIKGYNQETMSLEVMVGNADLGYVNIQNNEGYVWNTGKTSPGKYEIYAMLRDKKSGEIISVRKRIINLAEDFTVSNATLKYEPKIPVLEVLGQMDFEVNIETMSNTERQVEVCLNVADENGNILYDETQTRTISKDESVTGFSGFGFIPQIEEASRLHAQARIAVDGETVKVVDKTVRIHKGSDEGKIDADYTLSKDSVKCGEDEVTVDFNMTGIGMVMEDERKPVDLYITIDNSGSMEDYFENAKHAAIKIVSSLNEEDRCAVHFIDNLSGVKNFYGCEDKESLISQIEEKEIDTVWGTHFYNALYFAREIFEKKSTADREQVYLLLSDGETTEDVDRLTNQATRMANSGITIHTIQLGGAGEELLRSFASLGNGKYQMCPSGEDLSDMMNGIAGEIFGVAGSGAALSMCIENDMYGDVKFSVEPDKVIPMEDGTTYIEWNNDVVDIAQILHYSINFKTNAQEGVISLAKDVVLKYVSNYGKEVETQLGDININVEPKQETETEEETTSTQEFVIVEKTENNTGNDEEETGKEMDIAGRISADKWQMTEGDVVKLQYELENLNADNEVHTSIKIELVNVETEQSSDIQNKVHDIDAAGEIQETVQLEGENIKAGEYIVTLVLDDGGERTILSATGFVVSEKEEETTQNTENTTTAFEETITTQNLTTDETLENVTTQNDDKNNDKSDNNEDFGDNEDITGRDKTEYDNEEETPDSSNKNNEKNEYEELQDDSNETVGDIVQTGDYRERMLIIRNITLLLLLAVVISMLVMKKEEAENR